MSDKLDGWDVIKNVFEYSVDKTNGHLRSTFTTASGSSGTDLSIEEIWEQIYDPATDTIRVATV